MIIFGILLSISGLLVILKALADIFLLLINKNWEEAKGQIIRSEVEHKVSRTFSALGLYHSFSYYPDITYEYYIHGDRYESTRIYLGSLTPGSYKKADDIVEKYPLDRNVKVYYKKDNPDVAILDRKVLKHIFRELGFGLLFFMVGNGIVMRELDTGNLLRK